MGSKVDARSEFLHILKMALHSDRRMANDILPGYRKLGFCPFSLSSLWMLFCYMAWGATESPLPVRFSFLKFDFSLLLEFRNLTKICSNMCFSYQSHLNVHFTKSDEPFNLQNQDFLQLIFSISFHAASFLHSGALTRGC